MSSFGCTELLPGNVSCLDQEIARAAAYYGCVYSFNRCDTGENTNQGTGRGIL